MHHMYPWGYRVIRSQKIYWSWSRELPYGWGNTFSVLNEQRYVLFSMVLITRYIGFQITMPRFPVMKFAFDSGGATNIIKANYPSSNYESELSKPQTSKKDVGDHDRLREERIKIWEDVYRWLDWAPREKEREKDDTRHITAFNGAALCVIRASLQIVDNRPFLRNWSRSRPSMLAV